MPNLTKVRVTGLLGQFDHVVDFAPDLEFIILHGPNGVGKTKLLELIKAALSLDISKVFQIPFATANFSFDEGSIFIVDKSQQLTLGLDDDHLLDGRPETHQLVEPNENVVLTLSGSRADVTCTIEADATDVRRMARRISSSIPWLRQVADSSWYDDRLEEFLTSRELVERYGETFPSAKLEKTRTAIPREMRVFFSHIPVHLIETQRLFLLAARSPRNRTYGDEGTPYRQMVAEYSRDLTRRLEETLAQNSRTSQQLDRQFPRKLMSEASVPVEATDEAIRARYGDQSRIRARLAEISVLDAAYDVPLPSQELQRWQKLVLWTYLEDSEQKLNTFLPILERVDLLREIVNTRFLFKKMRIDRERGFRFTTTSGKEIGPGDLSSGEQHELVLAYDLLFNVAENSIVLIDEPEISLHASWQIEFLNDINRIAKLASFRFIVATHSPQIVDKWWPRTVALGEDA